MERREENLYSIANYALERPIATGDNDPLNKTIPFPVAERGATSKNIPLEEINISVISINRASTVVVRRAPCNKF